MDDISRFCCQSHDCPLFVWFEDIEIYIRSRGK
jgi:hypothetical protein